MSRWRKARPGAPTNPFLDSSTGQPRDPDTAGAAGQGPVVVTGPPAPVGATAPAKPALLVPADLADRRGEPAGGGLLVQVAGLHGGAGASTVAGLLGLDALDCGPGLAGLVNAVVPVLLVARTHAHGLETLRLAGQQWSAHGMEPLRILGVVLIDDGPQLSRGLSRSVAFCQRALPRCWRLGWCEDWRHDPDPPGPEGLPGRVRRVRANILTAASNTRQVELAKTAAPQAAPVPVPVEQEARS